nr:protein SMAX1-LIKE 6 [Ziziphus jujuba var. spinosa]
MPTPVSAARQCLTDEAARALDDAVAVARRRGHAQTTSLHAVSALLALPSSALREACGRARSNAYMPRLQFRALELSVGVSLDRLPSSKSLDEPPVSNSLMAAIKRSQANQRRHPENFHMYQIHNQQQTASLLKVELKHFILSILDDPIVSRVLSEAGFQSCDIKLALVQPPVTMPASRFSRTRCPPIFLCNLTDSDPGRRGFSFPFSGLETGDENCRLIVEVLIRKRGKNPLLIGSCANEALRDFTNGVQKGKVGLLPAELTGLTVICIEKEISEFVVDGGTKEKLDLKFEEVGRLAEQCTGPGIVLSLGELKECVLDLGLGGDSMNSVVSGLKSLLEVHGGKLWLIAAGTAEIYSKLLARFPTIEKDWDLHFLPISFTKAPTEAIFSKSSLLGSFVPFGGFFPAPSNFRNPLNSRNQIFTRCHSCNEKCENEVASILKVGSATLVAGDKYPENLPCWSQTAEHDTGKGVDVPKTIDDETIRKVKIAGLQKKWNEICQRLHHAKPYHKADISQAGLQAASAEGFHPSVDRKETSVEDSSLVESRFAFPSPCLPSKLQINIPSKQNRFMQISSDAEKVNCQSDLSGKVSKSWQSEIGSPCFSPYPMPNVNLPSDHASDRASSSSVTSVTTDLGLGTIYASPSRGPKCPNLQDRKDHQQHLSGSFSAELEAVSESRSLQIVQSSSCSASNFRGQHDPGDLKSLKNLLTEKVGWQDEAIYAISRAVCRSKSGGGRHRGLSLRGDIWLNFLGPDRVGKKRIALALAEIFYGTRESLISINLASQYRGSQADSIFEHEELDGFNVKFRSKTDSDYLAGELSKRPCSVVFLENVDRADILARRSLLHAIKTGKFPDMLGRQISINNVIFVTTSNIGKGNKLHQFKKDSLKFPEETILAAKKCQMQILIGCVAADYHSHDRNVRVTAREGTSNLSSVNKRKLNDTNGSTDQTFEIQKRVQKASRSFLDLNLPVEEIEENIDCEDSESDSISDSSEAWLEEFLSEVDEKVVFKPFDFDELAEKLVEKINLRFQEILRSEVILEIEYQVMVQILAAAWLSGGKQVVENWVEQVLCRGFAETKQKYHLTAASCVIRLVASGALAAEEQIDGVCLPSRIKLN